MHFTNDFLSHDDLYTVALLALLLVLINVRDWFRYGYDHRGSSPESLAPHPLQGISAIAARAFAAARFPHAIRTLTSPLMRRRMAPLAQRPGHRPLKPARG